MIWYLSFKKSKHQCNFATLYLQGVISNFWLYIMSTLYDTLGWNYSKLHVTRSLQLLLQVYVCYFGWQIHRNIINLYFWILTIILLSLSNWPCLKIEDNTICHAKHFFYPRNFDPNNFLHLSFMFLLQFNNVWIYHEIEHLPK